MTAKALEQPHLLPAVQKLDAHGCDFTIAHMQHTKQEFALTLMSQLVTKMPAQHTRSPQTQAGAMSAWLMSNWKRCDDQQTIPKICCK